MYLSMVLLVLKSLQGQNSLASRVLAARVKGATFLSTNFLRIAAPLSLSFLGRARFEKHTFIEHFEPSTFTIFRRAIFTLHTSSIKYLLSREMETEHDDTVWDPCPLFAGVVRTDGFRRIGEDRVVRNRDRETATAFAAWAALVRSDDELWVFADGSMRDVPQRPLLPQRGGYAVVYPHQTETAAWSASSWHLPVYNAGQSEFFGVCEALNTAVELRLGVHGATRWSADLHRPLRVTIFTDCLTVLDRLVAGLSGLLRDECWRRGERWRVNAAKRINATMAVPCLVKAIDLFCELEHQLNCTVEFRFIPGHDHWVWPHRTADTMAGAASLHGEGELDITSNNILPYYRPVGEELFEQCEEIARRHPDLDDEGRRW
ncbi:hypothetical protein B0T24DRAFT_710064 [Lasiosphaeria ovina]|uniref:RNase H type-1 domain-containing protein n=1 Tax=Lasiosphaeria ovina TaxID=92902 RepID=A0AAE0K064_9PEZI|nr:hypothetical protein B0T24DRAFT_710064 [Lasiosphaeria ovina]